MVTQETILEFHYKKGENNVGDMYCHPSHYFDLGNVTTDCISKCTKYDLNNKTIIVGGGGLIRKYFNKYTAHIHKQDYKNLIVWGIGHNFSWKENFWWPDWLTKSTLYGVRDYFSNRQHDYLPCVSCMDPAFDKTYQVTKNTAFFLHRTESANNYPESESVMHNTNTNLSEVIQFLGSANTVVTDSYHGAYWGLLLGKDVRVVSWTTKFENFKYQPTLITSIEDWKNHKPVLYPEGYLEECRTLNNKFYNRVKSLLK
jgi:hypothetical protein